MASAPPVKSGSGPPPPLPPGVARSGGPPPPPGMKALHSKKDTKLKRSKQMGNLYRLLKGKVEGSSLNGRTSHRKKTGSNSGGNSGQGMADALAEITKRSSYFQQIEEDVKNHSAAILELKSSIGSFRTKDMTDLTKFHKQVELHLEKLTDESQVLARFEEFPTKKLETIRMAVALYSKLEAIATTLKSWKVVSPVAQQLEKIESYFNKIKEEVDATDRNKDEESKRFKSHNIELDFSVLLRIKESMVDVSSNCIEVALKESKEAREAAKEVKSKSGSPSKMLWRAFQLAFRVYNFAGGQDERADRLTSELATEIETHPQI
ncbi:uncharacterized protein A4U43_C06F3000 [Asparagus officinalis]|uniref:Hydroxyproline-rich glycoprotein family protein n=2 Tax=Asparagus officinalis TaxID=4686 RepID=A0A5P1EJ43_ASPOF|nr:uncharacterized protein A4U43_C06F3000 [Asparagus officinalis]